MSTLAVRCSVRNIVNWISGASIFRQHYIVQVQTPRGTLEGNIFENRSKAPGGRVYFGFGFRREVDNLRVAAAFVVKDTFITPAMLVVANQDPVRVCRKRGLTCAGKPEKDCHTILRTNIGRT